MGMDLVNSEGYIEDFNAFRTEKKFPISFSSRLTVTDGVKVYESEPLNPRLAYEFKFLAPKVPKITINSFSFTRKNGEVIPSVLFLKSDTGIVMIDSLPASFIKDSLLVTRGGLVIFAECSESYHETKEVNINFDLLIDTIRIDTSFFYRRKFYFDMRPKLF